MSRFCRWCLWSCLLPCVAAAAPDEARLRDVGYVFHPARVAAEFADLRERLLLFAQAAAVLIIIGGLLARLKKSGATLEHLASMVLLVGFISTLTLWRTLVVEVGDAAADSLGNRAVSVASLEGSPPDAAVALTPFMLTFGGLVEQWALPSSPTADGLDGGWRPGDGREEEQLGKGWNWAKPPLFAATSPAEQAWAAETSAERAAFLHRLLFGVAWLLQVTQAAFYAAETLRWIFFHGGFALLPLAIAGLGTESFRGASLRWIVTVAGVALWPVGWCLANAATSAMLRAGTEILAKTAHAALYPQVGGGAARTIAQAAPHLSWSLLAEVSGITVALCLWMLATLAAAPVLLHLVAAAGGRWSRRRSSG